MAVTRHKASAFDNGCALDRQMIFTFGLTRRRATRTLLSALLVLAASASATDLARLRNGFTIRHERRTTIGDNTRLFLANDNASFVDIPTTSAPVAWYSDQ